MDRPFLEILSYSLFAGSVFCIRNTVIAMLEGSANTFLIWKGLREEKLSYQLKFFFKAVKATYRKGPKITGNPYGWYKYECDVIELANRFGTHDFVESGRLLAAGKACTWATLALWFAGLTFMLKVIEILVFIVCFLR